MSAAGDNQFGEALKRGSAYAWKGRWEDAVREYRYALELSPGELSARTYLAMALYKSGRLQESLDLYQELWRGQPSNLVMLQRMAEVQESLGDLEAAAASHRQLAEIYERRNSHQEALEALQRAVALKPSELDLWNLVMDASSRVGSVAQTMPGYLELARELALQGRFEAAIQVVERGRELDPSNPSMLPLLASIRRALEYSWRATAAGEEVLPEELARLIPVSTLDRAALSPEDAPESVSPEPPLETVQAPPAAAAIFPDPTEPLQAALVDHVADAESVSAALMPTEVEPTEEETSTTPFLDLEVPSVVIQEFSSVVREHDLEVGPSDPATQPEDVSSMDEGAEPDPPDDPPLTLEEPRVFASWEAESQSIHPRQDTAVGGEAGWDELSAAQPPDLGEDETAELNAGEEALPGGVAEDEGCTLAEAEAASELSPGEEELSIEIPEVEEDSAAEAPDGIANAEQLVGLAEAYEQLEQYDLAVDSYEKALESSPLLPAALLGLARLHQKSGRLDLAEAGARSALQAAAAAGIADDGAAAKLLLEILMERGTSGDLGALIEGLRWLRSTAPGDGLPPSLAAGAATAFAKMLGRCGSEHLDELSLLSEEEREKAVLSLRASEELLAGGQLRASSDEMYWLISSHPNFLPAHSMLGRILIARGRREEAKKLSQRLLGLYEVRGTPQYALEVLRWRVAHGVADGDDRARLVELLLAENRLPEAEAIRAGKLEEPGAPSRHEPDNWSGGLALVGDVDSPARGAESWEPLVRLAESRFAQGDVGGAADLLRAAMAGDGTDESTRAALARVLQVIGRDGRSR